ncbi:DUF4168 domain-containing protein [Aquamicrobium sp. LC103]|uniref:DUF4168 domain-containing protein n=1 Tax=Aquamicrobium sp. LC103 TaxID=1120658 RepID=UPI00063E8BC6|nr:DUF4168 domain-containing protein [Aquamicrobium sp. LC103]
MNLRTKLIAACSVVALGFGPMLGVVHAQEASPVPNQEQPSAEAPSFSDEKLKSFAVAFLEVSKITQEYQPQLEGAKTPEDQQRVQSEASDKMVNAVESSEGISVEEYTQIIQAAQTDPELAQKINGHITEAAQ